MHTLSYVEVAGKMVQWSGAFAVLTEDLGLVPSSHMGAYNQPSVTAFLGNLMLSSGLGHTCECGVCVCVCVCKTCIHNLY